MTAEIKKRYDELKKRVKSDEHYTNINLKWRVNRYVCGSCNHAMDTRDVDAGVTPYIISCEKCGEISRSSFYRASVINPKHKWYRPTLEELLKMDKNSIEHVLEGGLILTKIKYNTHSDEVEPKAKEVAKERPQKPAGVSRREWRKHQRKN